MAKTYKTPSGKLRARALGIPFDGKTGALNAITDVPGVCVGYSTIIAGPARTGVTAILPRGRDGIGMACAAGYHSFNGNGEMTGVSWINEAGNFSTPVMITNTHAVGTVHRGVIDWVAKHFSKKAEEWLLPVVAETWDGYLNDINGPHVTAQHAIDAINVAAGGAIEEGSVGGGTGMNCYGFKGGNGTASRVIDYGDHQYAVGVFLQANFGARHELTIAGDKIGQSLLADNPIEDYYSGKAAGAGSCIGIVATDAPMLPGQLNAMARRIALGLARTGTTGSHFSGDIFLAFSTANLGAFDSGFPEGEPSVAQNRHAEFVPWNRMNDFYAGVVHATEEAVINAMVANVEMIGFEGHRSPALPHAAVLAALK